MSTLATANMQTTVQVQAGDTYKSIAQAYNISISDLEKANGRQVGGFDIIYPGEKVAVPKATTQNTNTTSNTQSTTNNNTATQATQNTTTANNTTSSTSTSTSGARQMKISFYDPAAMGSSMGYGGVAANLSVFPRGTRLKITLPGGNVIYRTVNDTGSFAYSNPNQIDIAMPNSSIPSYGVGTATVEVVG